MQTSTVYMVKTLDSDPNQTPLNFADPTRRRRGQSLWDHDDDDTSVWSARFSADGNEVRSIAVSCSILMLVHMGGLIKMATQVVAGGNGKIFGNSISDLCGPMVYRMLLSYLQYMIYWRIDGLSRSMHTKTMSIASVGLIRLLETSSSVPLMILSSKSGNDPLPPSRSRHSFSLISISQGSPFARGTPQALRCPDRPHRRHHIRLCQRRRSICHFEW